MNILHPVLFPYLKLRLSPIEKARQCDINGTLAKINANGGKTLLPKISIGAYGFIAHFQNTERV